MDTIRPTDQPTPRLAMFATEHKRPQTREEAAEQFEQVFVRQLVKTFTDDLFKMNMSGMDSGAMRSRTAMQSDILADVLARRLTARDTFNLSELLLKQWNRIDR